MDRQDIQTRRAENQVWNGSGAYDTKPELLVFDGGGDADLYGNTVLGLAGRYYRFDLFRPLLNDFHRSVQEGLYTAGRRSVPFCPPCGRPTPGRCCGTRRPPRA